MNDADRRRRYHANLEQERRRAREYYAAHKKERREYYEANLEVLQTAARERYRRRSGARPPKQCRDCGAELIGIHGNFVRCPGGCRPSIPTPTTT